MSFQTIEQFLQRHGQSRILAPNTILDYEIDLEPFISESEAQTAAE